METPMKSFNQGEKIYDPYTKESLGRDEIRVGNAVVIDTKPKYSVLGTY